MKKKPGPKPENGIGRVRLWGSGPPVSLATKLTLDSWKDLYVVPPGRAIDAMVAFCANNPAFKLLVK